MNKFLLTLLCGGSLMTISGCGQHQEAKVEETEVAVTDSAAVKAEEVKTEATEINVDSAVVVEAAVEEKSAAVASEKQDDKF
jgi:hypothetical protein